MLLLLLFAALAGAGTALSPCVLPVLPAVLAAGTTGGRRRPFGVVLGLATTFALTVAGLAEVVDRAGLGDGTLRSLAVLVLLGGGVLLFVPRATARVEAALSRLAPASPRSRGNGFVSGLGVGAALGLVYAPCAGPILAAVISVGAASGAGAALAVAYAAGSAAVLLAILLLGRRPLRRLRGPWPQRALGVVMVATALVVATQLDVRFQATIADDLPALIVNPTGALERSAAVERRLATVAGPPRFASTGPRSSLPDHGAAPEFADVTRWRNSGPLTMRGLRGKVVLVDFWTYSCVNCLRTLPYLRAWDARYRDDGLVIVGVHTPEYAFERDPGNVRGAVERLRLRYPVAQDDEWGTWDAWGNRYWPAKYLVDARGRVRYTHFGEGAYKVTENAIRSLLAEAGRRRLGGPVDRPPERLRPRKTPETYVGAARAERWTTRPETGERRYPTAPRTLYKDTFQLMGRWRVGPEAATARAGAAIRGRVKGRVAHMVMGSPDGRPRAVEVAAAGMPVRRVTVRGLRLYRLGPLSPRGWNALRLRVEPGIAVYSLTFG